MGHKLFGYINYNYNINGKLTAMAAYSQKEKLTAIYGIKNEIIC